MKKRLFDFSPFNAITVVLAYASLLTIALFSVFNSDGVEWASLVVAVLLLLSFALVLWYFVFLAVTVTDKGISHGRVFIRKKDLRWSVEEDSRFRQMNLVFRDRGVNYDRLTKKERAKSEITIQYFPKHERFLQSYFASDIEKPGETHEKKTQT